MKVFVTVLLALIGASASKADNPSAQGQFPSVVIFLSPNNFGGHNYGCSGVIVSPTTILTSASCVQGSKYYAIQAGLNRVEDGRKNPLPSFIQEVSIDSWVVHPDFDVNRDNRGLTSLNDIALVKLKGSITYTNNIKAASLPAANAAIADGSSIQAVGWGKYLDASGYVYGYGVQQFATLTAVNYQACYNALDAFLAGTDTVTLDKDTTECAGPLQDASALPPTWGDAGGPIIQNGNVVGISSYSPAFFRNAANQKKTGPVGVYTTVSRYVSWIRSNTADL